MSVPAVYTSSVQRSSVTQRGFAGAQKTLTGPGQSLLAGGVCAPWSHLGALQCCLKPSGQSASACCDQAGLQAHHPTRSAMTQWLLGIFQPFQPFSAFRGVVRWILKTTLKKPNNQADIPPKPIQCLGKGFKDVHGTSPSLGPC